MQIDLRAKILPEGCKVWRMFPGKSYGLLADFINRNAAFLEMPGLSVAENLSEDKNLFAKVYAALHLAELKRIGGETASPVVRWQDYVNVHVDTTLGRLANSVINFFEVAKQGDLIIVPDHKSRGVVRIGSFLEGSKSNFYVDGVRGYGGYPFPARGIHWITPVDETLLSPKLSGSLRHEHAFGALAPELYNEVFSLAYGNFIGNGVFSSTVYNGDELFTDGDNTFIGVIFTLAAYACEARDNGRDAFEIDDIFDFLFNRPPLEYACLFSSEHHSPGFTRYLSQKATALVAVGALTAFIAIAESADAAEVGSSAPQVTFVNSLDPNAGACDPEIEEAQRILFRSIGGDKLRKACQILLEAKRRAKLGVRSRRVKRDRQ